MNKNLNNSLEYNLFILNVRHEKKRENRKILNHFNNIEYCLFKA